jgi:regulator of sirC expression with transglutaminase-like and TPR domain
LSTDPYREFRQAVDRPEEKIDLGRAALTIAQTEYPDLDIGDFLSRIDALAVEVARGCPADADVHRTVAALNTVLFKQHGYRGNQADYYDPRNSFLNQVIERRTGIPITLSVLYMEVAQRVGLKLEGIGFPGHFMVKHVRGGEEMIIDPFHRGEIKSREDLARLIQDRYGGKVSLSEELTQAAGKKQILKRMLTNLKMIYTQKNDLVKSLSALDRLVILDPAAAADIRDRGAIYLRLECFTQAREDLQRYLRLAPDAEDAAEVREQIVSLAKEVTRLH